MKFVHSYHFQELDALAVNDHLKKITRKARDRANSKGLELDIDEAFVRQLLVSQNWRCAISGLPFDLKPSRTGRRMPFAPSIDKIDTRNGYVRGNVRLTCVIVNLARGDFSDDEMNLMCDAISRKFRNQQPLW